MAQETIRLEVATPLGLALSIDVIDFQARADEIGYFTVMPHHRPYLAALGPGVLSYRLPGDVNEPRHVALGGGFIEVRDQRALVVVDNVAKREDVDVEVAKKDLADAENRLAAHQGYRDVVREQAKDPYFDIVRDLEWARARLDVAAELR